MFQLCVHPCERPGGSGPQSEREVTTMMVGGAKVVRQVERIQLSEDQLRQLFPSFDQIKQQMGGEVLEMSTRGAEKGGEKGASGDAVEEEMTKKVSGVMHAVRKVGSRKRGEKGKGRGRSSDSDEEDAREDHDEVTSEAQLAAMRNQELKFVSTCFLPTLD